MAIIFEKDKELIISKVISRIKNSVTHQPEACVIFITQLYGSVSLEDLEQWAIDDLVAAAHFGMLRREPEKPKYAFIIPIKKSMVGTLRIPLLKFSWKICLSSGLCPYGS